MKKILFGSFAVLFINFFCFVQLPLARADEAATFVGIIESFPCGFGQFKSGPPLWPVGMIVVTGNNGEKNNFLIVRDGPNATVFYDADGKATSVLNDIKGMNDIRAIIGKRVEVKYAVTAESMRYANKQLAISVRFVSQDYVSQPGVFAEAGKPNNPAPQSSGQGGVNLFVGKIESSPPTFRIPPMRKIILISNNGERLTVFVSREIAIRDMKAYPTRIGERAEVKYLPAANGDNEAVSFRYVPSDYVQQPAAPTVSTQTLAATAAGQGNVFIGRIEKITPTVSHGNLTAPRCRILVTADNGEQSEFFVSWVCPLMDMAGKDLHQGVNAPFILKKGQRIEIKYSTITNGNSITNGQKGADSIRCLD
ncbi:MAG: hypothetical protein M0R48_05940 [Candidatus Omnitrophica bacterium]|jgi:hypothetical protein|nr:hypothetical protein [Candidatus Omnitrophota bacterium]